MSKNVKAALWEKSTVKKSKGTPSGTPMGRKAKQKRKRAFQNACETKH